MAKWKSEYDQIELAKRIEETRKESPDGKVKFEGFITKLHQSLLYSMIDFSHEIPEIDGRRIANKAIFKAGEKGDITEKRLLTEIKNLERDYLNKPFQRFVLVTSISLGIMSTFHRIYLKGRNQIIIEPRLPGRFLREELQIRKQANHILFTEPPSNYLAVRVHVAARSPYHAAELALDNLDFVRGIWNFIENRRHTIRWSSGKPSPVNEIILGPYHFLHYLNGKLASESIFWYEKSYLGAIRPHTFADIQNCEDYTNKIKTYIKKSNYAKEIKVAIIRYSRALDERIWDHAFTRLWGVLELLTNTMGPRYSQSVTIKRAAYFYKEYDFAHQILKQLRDYRNRSIHADAENSEIEAYLYQLKNIIEDLLHFHIFNSFKFNSLNDAGRFLDLPHDKDALKLRADMANYALECFYSK